jgi:hypothetical protein
VQAPTLAKMKIRQNKKRQSRDDEKSGNEIWLN